MFLSDAKSEMSFFAKLWNYTDWAKQGFIAMIRC